MPALQAASDHLIQTGIAAVHYHKAPPEGHHPTLVYTCRRADLVPADAVQSWQFMQMDTSRGAPDTLTLEVHFTQKGVRHKSLSFTIPTTRMDRATMWAWAATKGFALREDVTDPRDTPAVWCCTHAL